jgi:hypothetical protein
MMRSFSCVIRGPGWAAFFLGAIQAAVCHAAPVDDLSFERVFSAAKEPVALHYRASYSDSRGGHELEVWRDGQTRLRRRTDSGLDLYAVQGRDGDLSVTMLDHVRRIRTDVSRSNLFRLGQFVDWYGLAHSFGKPPRPYILRTLAASPTAEAPWVSCRWYQLDAEPQHSAICWSPAYRLPVLIADSKGRVRWRLTWVDKSKPAAETFAIVDQNYIRVDADRDIHAD